EVAWRSTRDVGHGTQAAQTFSVTGGAGQRLAVAAGRGQFTAALDGSGWHVRDPARTRIAQPGLVGILGGFDDAIPERLCATFGGRPEDFTARLDPRDRVGLDDADVSGPRHRREVARGRFDFLVGQRAGDLFHL